MFIITKKQWVANKTRRVRHEIASLVVPALRGLLDLQRRPMIRYVKETFGDKALVGCEMRLEALRKVLFVISGAWLLWLLAWALYVEGDKKRC